MPLFSFQKRTSTTTFTPYSFPHRFYPLPLPPSQQIIALTQIGCNTSLERFFFPHVYQFFLSVCPLCLIKVAYLFECKFGIFRPVFRL